MNVLVVCELNFARSVTTAFLLKRKSKKENLNLKVESAGFFTKKLKRNPLEDIIYFSKKYISFIPKKEITKKKARWADRIIVMEQYMADILKNEYDAEEEKIICFDISPRHWFPYKLVDKKLKETNFY